MVHLESNGLKDIFLDSVAVVAHTCIFDLFTKDMGRRYCEWDCMSRYTGYLGGTIEFIEEGGTGRDRLKMPFSSIPGRKQQGFIIKM